MRILLMALLALGALGQQFTEPRVVIESMPAVGVPGNVVGRFENLPAGSYRVFFAEYAEDRGWFSTLVIPPLLGSDRRFTLPVAFFQLRPTRFIVAAIPQNEGFPYVSGDAGLPAVVLNQPARYMIDVPDPETRRIWFAGRQWRVKKKVVLPAGPGPNMFSDSTDHVFVDGSGRLHLRIAPCGPDFCSSEVILDQSLGYGKYTFRVETPIESLHPAAVAGLFTWSYDPLQSHREIDIELTRWNNTVPTNAQYVVQPFNAPGQMLRFNLVNLNTYDFAFDWAPQSVIFSGNGPTWEMANAAAVPKPGDERVHMNLYWFRQGSPWPPPPQGLIVRDFRFEPSTRAIAGPSPLVHSRIPATGDLRIPVGVQQNAPWSFGAWPIWLQPEPLNGSAGLTQTRWVAHPNWSRQQRIATVTAGQTAVTFSQDANTGTEEERLVGMLYYNFFQRIPEPWEVDFQILNTLQKGLPAAHLASNLLNSLEFNEGGRFAAGLYMGLLDRDPDYAGWRWQTRALSAGDVTQVQLVMNFLNSPEFNLKYGQMTDTQFVRLMYRNILRREAANWEVDFQLPFVANRRPEWTSTILRSEEFRRSTDARLNAYLLYATLLNRDATTAERSARIQALQSGTSISTLISDFTNSLEFSLGYR